MLNNKELQDLTGFYVNWHGISAVLSTYFFLITKCLSVALTDYPHCPSKTDVTQKFIRGTKNFETYCVLPGGNRVQIHIHVQIAPRRHILCRRCRLLYEILSAPNKFCQTSVLLTNSADSLSNIGKTLYIVKRKICVLELRYFMPDIETC